MMARDHKHLAAHEQTRILATLSLCVSRYSFTDVEQHRSTEPVRIREYGWCLGFPPRCSKYRTDVKEIIKYQVSVTCWPSNNMEGSLLRPASQSASRRPVRVCRLIDGGIRFLRVETIHWRGLQCDAGY